MVHRPISHRVAFISKLHRLVRPRAGTGALAQVESDGQQGGGVDLGQGDGEDARLLGVKQVLRVVSPRGIVDASARTLALPPAMHFIHTNNGPFIPHTTAHARGQGKW